MTKASKFGLPARHDFPRPWKEKERATKTIQNIMKLMEKGLIDEKEARRIIKKADKVIDKPNSQIYKIWLDKYNKFTNSLEKLCVRYNMI